MSAFSQMLLRMPALIERTGLSRSGIYARLDPRSRYYDPCFPRQVHLSSSRRGAVAWLAPEVDAWIGLQVARSRQSQPIRVSHESTSDQG